jgi:flagellar motor switch protein FliG
MVTISDASPKEAGAVSGVRKAAILLLMIGEDASSAILKELDEEEVQEVTREVARVQSLSSEEAEGVLEEFYQKHAAHEFMLKGGVDYARKLIYGAFGAETGRNMVDRLVKTLGNETLSFDALRKTDPQQLAKFIHNEHPQTIALILSHLNPSQAAGLLLSLPSEMRADVALRMANLDQISPEIISKIANVIGTKLKAVGELSREAYGGVHAVAEMFNRLDSNTSKDILETIEQTNSSLVETIRHMMFVFEDMLLLDGNAIKEVLAKVDRKILTVALKGTSEQMKNHMLQAMSQRGAEMLREDMEALGPVKIKEVEAAQQQIIAVWRRPGTLPHFQVGTAQKREQGSSGSLAESGIPLKEVEARTAAAYHQGYAAGEQAGSARANSKIEPVLASLNSVIAELAGARRLFRAEAEEATVSLAIAIARRVLHRELSTDPEAILGLVKAAFQKCDAKETHRLSLSPPDADSVQQHRGQLRLPTGLDIVADAALQRGSAVFETSRGVLDVSAETQLAEIERGFADVLRRRNA